MKDKQLTQSEIRAVQLEMLDEVDAFCRANGIRYSLAFGTLLGAVRHKGYIPWDDDMDIIMPLPDLLRFKELFKSEKIQYLDIDTVKHYPYHFSRIAYRPTYSKINRFVKSYGVNIDFYPVAGMPDTEEDIQKFLNDLQPLYDKRRSYIKRRMRFLRRLPFAFIPGFDSVISRFRSIVLNSFPYHGAKNFLHAGSVRRVNIFGFDVFDTMTEYDFEGHKYMGLARYDEYLTQCYGDYMKLPPEDKRAGTHGGIYFWKS